MLSVSRGVPGAASPAGAQRGQRGGRARGRSCRAEAAQSLARGADTELRPGEGGTPLHPPATLSFRSPRGGL